MTGVTYLDIASESRVLPGYILKHPLGFILLAQICTIWVKGTVRELKPDQPINLDPKEP